MNREQVQELEQDIEQALANLFQQIKAGKRLLRNQPPVDAKTLHLMAKAAVTVLEATEVGYKADGERE